MKDADLGCERREGERGVGCGSERGNTMEEEGVWSFIAKQI